MKKSKKGRAVRVAKRMAPIKEAAARARDEKRDKILKV